LLSKIVLNTIGNMGTWSTAIKDSDAFLDVYSEFFDLYNKGGQPDIISKKIIEDNWEILEIDEEKHSLWFALALAQWETKKLDPNILSRIEQIIVSGADLAIWYQSGATEADIKKRKTVLDNFLKKLKSDRPNAKPRKRPKQKTPIFSTGDCVVFKMNNGNYGGAVVFATDPRPETACNLVATTRLNQITKPTIKDFENSEVLICNFGQWQDRLHVVWYMPDLFYKDYSNLFEIVGKIDIKVEYSANNYDGSGYLFHPSWTAGWDMKLISEKQFESETTKSKPLKVVTIKQLTQKV
jgi:hypothetical protein